MLAAPLTFSEFFLLMKPITAIQNGNAISLDDISQEIIKYDDLKIKIYLLTLSNTIVSTRGFA